MNQSEYLQTPEQHQQSIERLERCRHPGVVAHRVDIAEARAHIAQTGHRTREPGQQIHTAQRGENRPHEHRQHVGDDEDHHTVDGRIVLHDAVEANADHGVGVLLAPQLGANHLTGQHQPVGLHATRRRTRTRTDNRTEHQQNHGKRRPDARIGRGKTRRSHQREELEGRMPERCRNRGVDVGGIERNGDQHAAHEQDAHVPARHLRAEDVVALARNRRVDQPEVHARHTHREDQHRVDPRIVVEGHAGIFGREAACRTGRHRMTERIEPVHARQAEHDGRECGQTDIDHQQDVDNHLCAVAVVVLGQRREFDIREGHLAASHRRKYHEREHHHTHAADPRGREAPELQPARKSLDIGQHRGSGGRKARNALEPGVHQTELPAPDQVGEHPDHTRQKPRTDDDAEPLLVGDLVALAYEDQREGPEQGGQQGRQQQGIECRIHAVQAGDPRRKQHEARDEEHHDSDISQNHVYPHSDPISTV